MRSITSITKSAYDREYWARHTTWAIMGGCFILLLISPLSGQEPLEPGPTARPVAPPPLPTPVASKPVPTSSQPTGSTGPLTIADIMAMHQAGLGDQVIIGSIRQHSLGATLSVDELIAMKRHGVSNEVIHAMQQQAPLPPAKSPSRAVVQPTVVEPVVQPVIVSPPVYRPIYHPPVIYTHRYYVPYRHYHRPVRHARSSFGIHVRF